MAAAGLPLPAAAMADPSGAARAASAVADAARAAAAAAATATAPWPPPPPPPAAAPVEIMDGRAVAELLGALGMDIDSVGGGVTAGGAAGGGTGAGRVDMESLMRATFQWPSRAQARRNMQLMFPTFVVPVGSACSGGAACSGAATSSGAGWPATVQQQQQQQEGLHWAPLPGGAPPPGGGKPAPHSPFSGVDAAAILAPAGAPGPTGRLPQPPMTVPGEDAEATAHIRKAQQALLEAHRAQQGSRQQRPEPQGQCGPPEQAPEQVADGDGGDSDGDAPQPRRRGRPCKVPGQYSKGYLAIKRYRQKKRGMLQQMEDDVAAKQQQLESLQAERDALLRKQRVLEATMGNQDAMLSDLEQLTLSIGPVRGVDDLAVATSEAALAAACAIEAAQRTGPAPLGPLAAQAVQAGVAAQARQAARQAAEQRAALVDLPALLARYRQYVQDAGVWLAEQVAGSPQPRPCPGFPFAVTEALHLWKLGRVAGAPRAAESLARCGSLEGHGDSADSAATASSDRAPGEAAAAAKQSLEQAAINLTTGKHDSVGMDFWRDVAQSISLRPSQKKQLAEVWQLYSDATKRLNQDRLQLLLQLQQRLADPAAPTLQSWGSAVVLAPGWKQQLLQQHQQQCQQAPMAGSAASSHRIGDPGGSGSSFGGDSATAATAAPHGGGGGAGSGVGGAAFSPVPAVAGTASGGSGGTAPRPAASADFASAAGMPRTLAGGWSGLEHYHALADGVEANLVRGRAQIMMYGWSMLSQLDAEQAAHMFVASWPYFPLLRAVVGWLLAMPALAPEQHGGAADAPPVAVPATSGLSSSQ